MGLAPVSFISDFWDFFDSNESAPLAHSR